MNKLTVVLLLLLLVACRGPAGGMVAGASSPRTAVETFLAAAQAEDLTAFGLIWGSARGPATQTMERAEREQRQLILMRLLCQEESRMVGQSPGVDDRQVLRLELTRRGRTVPVNFTTIRGPGDRWFVEDVEVLRLQDLCVNR